MTRKVVSLTENSSAVHRSMLKEPWIRSETSQGDISKNKSKEVKSMSDHTNFENVLKEKSSDKNTIVNLHSMQSVNSIVKINNKKSTKKLYGKKLNKIGRQKSPKLIRPFRCTKLPYGCVWNGKEGRFAIRIHSPKLKNEFVYISSQDSTNEKKSRLHKENDIEIGYDKHKFENVPKENLNYNENIKPKSFMNMENGLPGNESEHDKNDLYDKTNYKNVKQITKLVRPRRNVKLPYGCVWSGTEGRFAVRVVSPKAMNVETKMHPNKDEQGSLHILASVSTTMSYR